MNHWIALIGAIVFETIGTTMLKKKTRVGSDDPLSHPL